MKFFVILLIFLGSAMLAPNAFGSELFYGTSSIERFPQVIDSDEPQIIEIKFQYQEGPYSLNIEPLFVVSPKEAVPFVQIEFDEVEGIPRMSVKRMIGTITVDQDITSEKIFLNISYNGTYAVAPPQPFKSSWSDTMIIDIEKNLVPEPDDNLNLEKEPFCGEGTTYTEGICVVDEIDDSTETSEKWGKYSSTVFESPLKQFRSETTFNETQCRDSLILVMRHNGSPACVNFDTIPKLIQRGWIDTDPRAEADKNIPKYLCELYGGGFFDETGECMDVESSYKCQMSGGEWDGKCMIPNYMGKGIGTEADFDPNFKPDCIDGKCMCPDGFSYNQVLFKCVISCEEDLVYNGYTDSCTTEFELKYHGFCNDSFTYSPSSHECYSDNDTSQIPLKDPPRTPPPEPEPTYTLTEVNCFTNQVIYNDECIYVLNPTDEFPKKMTKYFSMVDDVIVNFCEIKPVTEYDGEDNSGVTLDRCFEISHYTISDVNAIKFQSTTPPTWINIQMENLTRYVELGSSPTFRIIESGWGNGCTSPTLEVYHMKQEFDTDPPVDDLIYKHRIVYSCPYYEPIYPPQDVLRIWDESDFPNFPICEEEGKYLIIGDSGYERLALYYYYCGIENEN